MNTVDDVLSGRKKWCVYEGDYRKVLGSVYRKIAACITDPPYGISHQCAFKSKGRSNLAECNDYPNVHDDDKPFDPIPILGLRVPTVLWGANWYANRLPNTGGWLVWDKERPDDLDQATCELAWTNCVKGVRRFRHLWNGMMRASEHGDNYHPTQKPVALSVWVLNLRWLPRSGIIFDPFCGSGSIGAAAVQMGYRFIGCEIEPRYVSISRRRLANAESSPVGSGV